jgi:DNA repair protein RadD
MGITKVIIDECDRFPREPNGMLRRFLNGAGIVHTLGLTATPLKLQTNLGADFKPFSKLVMLTNRSKKGNFFKKIIYVAQIQEMVELGFWSRLEYQSYDFNTGDLVYNTTGADYSDASIKRAYKSQNIGDKIVKKVEQLYNRKAILIAVPSIDEAKELTTRIPSCKAVYSDMPAAERKEIIDDFKSGKLRCIAQVNILSVGFDYPELDCIITGRPTASLSWWYQFVGRVTRIHPNKSEGLVVDFVGAVPKFGKVEDIYFKEEESGWIMYGEDKKQLTGIPLSEIGLHIEGEATPQEKAASGEKVLMPFGKFAGKEVREIPASYREWMLTNFNWNPFNQKVKDEILRLKSIGI